MIRGSRAVIETKLAQVGERSLSYTVGNSRVGGVGEGAQVRVSGRDARLTIDAPLHDAREVGSTVRRAGHRAAAVALTRVRTARRARAQHRRVYLVALRQQCAGAPAVVRDAHSVQKHAG